MEWVRSINITDFAKGCGQAFGIPQRRSYFTSYTISSANETKNKKIEKELPRKVEVNSTLPIDENNRRLVRNDKTTDMCILTIQKEKKN